jgi:hypothetical protein
MTKTQDYIGLAAGIVLSISIAFCYYFLYQKYYSLSVCQQQSLQLDTLEKMLKERGR